MPGLLCGILAPFLLTEFCQPSAKAATFLESGKPVDGSLDANAVQEHQVRLASGEFLHVLECNRNRRGTIGPPKTSMAQMSLYLCADI
jgi:hypothetical protein